MSELIQRLRSGFSTEDSWTQVACRAIKERSEAANALEAQAKRIAEQDATLKTYSGEIDGWKRAHQNLESNIIRERAQHELALCNLREAQSKLFNSGERIAELEARLAQVEVDAGRYRWLRDIGDSTWAPMGARVPEGAAGVDAAIDAVMKEQA